ncbi:hypothetical protein OROMI_008218 [Orobanche minor]
MTTLHCYSAASTTTLPPPLPSPSPKLRATFLTVPKLEALSVVSKMKASLAADTKSTNLSKDSPDPISDRVHSRESWSYTTVVSSSAKRSSGVAAPIDAGEFNHLPRLLAGSLAARNPEMKQL